MRIAVLADVHGNAPALEAVLCDAAAQSIDRYLLLGDYIFDMPFSNEVVRIIQEVPNATVVAGNKEGYLHGLRQADQATWLDEQCAVLYQTFRALPQEDLAYLLALPTECTVTLESGKTIYVSHYLYDIIGEQTKWGCTSARFHENMLAQPFSHDDFLHEMDAVFNKELYRQAVTQIGADVIVYGHDHLQYYGHCGDTLIVNPGSCGSPLDFNTAAPYTILEETENGFTVEERRVPYDVAGMIQKAKLTDISASGEIWSELCFLALTTGRDYYGFFWKIAHEIRDAKGETGYPYSNETWRESYRRFCALYL